MELQKDMDGVKNLLHAEPTGLYEQNVASWHQPFRFLFSLPLYQVNIGMEKVVYRMAMLLTSLQREYFERHQPYAVHCRPPILSLLPFSCERRIGEDTSMVHTLCSKTIARFSRGI